MITVFLLIGLFTGLDLAQKASAQSQKPTREAECWSEDRKVYAHFVMEKGTEDLPNFGVVNMSYGERWGMISFTPVETIGKQRKFNIGDIDVIQYRADTNSPELNGLLIFGIDSVLRAQLKCVFSDVQ